MSSEQTKEQVRRWFDLFSREDWEAHTAEITAFFNTPEEAREYIEGQRVFRDAFAGYHFTTEHLLVEGDTVAIFGTVRATHVAEFPVWELKGVAATGKELEWTEVHLVDLVDGKWDISNYCFLIDGVGRLQQLGVLPQPE